MKALFSGGLPDPPAWGPYSWEISSWHASLHFLVCGEKAEEKGRKGKSRGPEGREGGGGRKRERKIEGRKRVKEGKGRAVGS